MCVLVISGKGLYLTHGVSLTAGDKRFECFATKYLLNVDALFSARERKVKTRSDGTVQLVGESG